MDRQDADHPAGDRMTGRAITLPDQPIGRRSLLKGAGAGALAVGAGGLLAACGSGLKGVGASSSTGTIKIGFITPLTGDLADFGASDKFVLSTIRATSAFTKAWKIGGKTYKVEIIPMDSQSSPTRAGQVATQLITSNKVDLVLTTSTPETTNPVSVVCERAGTPCLSTVVPWESWYAGLGGDPLKPTKAFTYCSMFFFGMAQFGGCFLPMWSQVSTDKVAACMYPNDADGDAFRAGFTPLAEAKGYKMIDPAAYADGTADYTSMISTFKSSKCELFTNCPLPPDFNTMWKQASEQGWKPKLATVAKVLLFPSDTAALGALVNNIATDSWWGPYMPYSSSLTGQSASALAKVFESSTGTQWTQSIGSSYSLFEVAKEALTSISDPHDKAELASALHKVNYNGICGPLNFAAGPAPGVGIIQPVGVQWKKSAGPYPFEMKVVDNTLNSGVKIEASLEPTNA
jgi:branched-chain amino acid transport system substrate-binding protein